MRRSPGVAVCLIRFQDLVSCPCLALLMVTEPGDVFRTAALGLPYASRSAGLVLRSAGVTLGTRAFREQPAWGAGAGAERSACFPRVPIKGTDAQALPPLGVGAQRPA